MIFDCFPFCNEFEVLDIRLNEIDQLVDYFVISESNLTHSGKPKPLYLKQALEEGRLDQFKEKIIRIEADISAPTPWERENKQRLALMEGLERASGIDLVMVSDTDEIPSQNFINYLVYLFQHNTNHPFILSKQFFYYYNFKQRKKELCHGTIGFLKGSLLANNKTLQQLRDERFTLPAIARAGWHLSFFGTPELIRSKIESFAHTEFGNHNDINKIKDRVEAGKDIFGRVNPLDELIAVTDNQIPSYVLSNREKFKHIL